MRLKGNTARLFILFFLILFIVIFAGSSTGFASDKFVYLKYNIHAQQHRNAYKASYANWTNPGRGYTLFPVNTEVKVGKWGGWRGREGFSLTTRDGKKILVEYNSKNMGMSLQGYINLITSPKPVSLEGLSEKDLEGIRLGRALVGMTKKGVMMALGYPAAHRTPSLEDNIWVYWKNRFTTKEVIFGQDGKVIEAR